MDPLIVLACIGQHVIVPQLFPKKERNKYYEKINRIICNGRFCVQCTGC